MKKEILADAFNEERNQAFAMADKLADKYEKEHWPTVTVDHVIKFLMDVQKITGHFPISREIPTAPFGFRL